MEWQLISFKLLRGTRPFFPVNFFGFFSRIVYDNCKIRTWSFNNFLGSDFGFSFLTILK